MSLGANTRDQLDHRAARGTMVGKGFGSGAQLLGGTNVRRMPNLAEIGAQHSPRKLRSGRSGGFGGDIRDSVCDEIG
jgi:hypothetical protein